MKKFFHTVSALALLSFALVPYASASGQTERVAEAEALTAGSQAPAPACGKCGDRYCATQCGETAASCPKDCGTAW